MYPVVSGADFMQAVFPPIQMIIGKGVLPTCCKMLVFGPSKIGKSMLMNQLTACVSKGDVFLGFDTVQSKVLSISLEIPPPLWQLRFQAYCTGKNVQLGTELLLSVPLSKYKYDLPDGQAELEETIAYYQPQVVVIDPLFKVLSKSTNDDERVQAMLDFLDEMIAKYGVSFIIVHHTRKPKGDFGNFSDWSNSEMRGSGLLNQWPDSIVGLDPITPKGDKTRMHFWVRHSTVDSIEPINISMDKKCRSFEIKP